MKQSGMPLIFLLAGILLFSGQGFATGFPDEAESYRISKLFPGGDVLRPSRAGASEFKWYLGLDAGITFSSFHNGPIEISFPNPYFFQHPVNILDNNTGIWYDLSLLPAPSTLSSGNGLGFTFGGVIDLGFTKHFGLVGKVNYHTRSGSFDQTTTYNLPIVSTDGSVTYMNTSFHDKVDWTFNYIGFDLLARIQLQEDAWYLLFGPAYSSLSTNKAKYTQTIVNPTNIFYFEQNSGGIVNIDHNYRQASGEVEISNVTKSRWDLKLGVGTWIPLTKSMFLTPELSLAYPLSSKLIETTPSSDFNMFTMFFTIGLRWKMN
jgi:hypothetical protein